MITQDTKLRWNKKTQKALSDKYGTDNQKILFCMFYMIRNGVDVTTAGINTAGNSQSVQIKPLHLVHAKRMMKITKPAGAITRTPKKPGPKAKRASEATSDSDLEQTLEAVAVAYEEKARLIRQSVNELRTLLS